MTHSVIDAIFVVGVCASAVFFCFDFAILARRRCYCDVRQKCGDHTQNHTIATLATTKCCCFDR